MASFSKPTCALTTVCKITDGYAPPTAYILYPKHLPTFLNYGKLIPIYSSHPLSTWDNEHSVMTDHARIKPRMSAKVARACVCGEVRRKKPLPFDFEKGRKRYDGVPYHERKTEQVDSCKAEGTNLDADHSKTLRLTPVSVWFWWRGHFLKTIHDHPRIITNQFWVYVVVINATACTFSFWKAPKWTVNLLLYEKVDRQEGWAVATC